MTASPLTIWQVPAYLPYLQSALTDSAVVAAEQKIGYKLPSTYLSLLKEQNGGYIRFSLPGTVHRVIAGIGPYFPSLTRFDWDNVQKAVSFPLEGLVPFDGDGHWYLCLDYRQQQSDPTVTHVDIECDKESSMASSFAGYLAKLQFDVGEDYVVEDRIDKVCSALSGALRVVFEPPDTWAHGYPVHRADLGTKKNPEWIWISPNSVPRGFVRPEHARYDALKALMPGFALRYPDVPADACILSTTQAVRAKVVHACGQLRIIVRSLREYVQAGNK
jgi:hypothetical protein